eukprot:1105281-Pyramimonas_sp.AAC.1
MAPPPSPQPRILRGPKKPHWGCPSCGCSTSWASRVVCQCGKHAPQHAQVKARKADKEAAAAA